jgi:hypothetical protein
MADPSLWDRIFGTWSEPLPAGVPTPPPIGDIPPVSALPSPSTPAPTPQQPSPYYAANLAHSIYSGVTLPGDVATGKASMTDPATQNRVMDLTGLVQGGGLAMGDAPAGSLGMFAGRRAKTADLGLLDEAKRLKSSPDDIIDRTQWFRGPDQKWRFEIPDDQAKLMLDATNRLYTAPLEDVLIHPELYAAYPDFKTMLTRVDLTNPNPSVYGAYLPTGYGAARQINLNRSSLGTMLHEVQHAIQQRENFATGGNVDMMSPSNFPDWGNVFDELLKYNPTTDPRQLTRSTQHEGYRRLAGETEARNVSTRQGFSPGSRARLYPWDTEEYPPSRQIVLPPQGQTP